MQKYTTIIGILKMRNEGISYMECQGRYKVGTGTVTRICQRWKELDLSIPQLEEMEPKRVEDLFYPPDGKRHKAIPLPDYDQIYERLMAKGSKANLFYLWDDYSKTNPGGYQYTQFLFYFHEYMKKNHGSEDVSMAVERVPGERVFIDWIGDQPEILISPKTGEMKKVHVFITTVGVSSLVYAEVFEDERESNFVKGTVHAIEYYGAVPRYLVPDNLKTAVTKHSKDELLINTAYQDLEHFYDVVIVPPPARKPKGKPTVENGVRSMETWLIETLKRTQFTTIESINEVTKKVIADFNTSVHKGQKISRMDSFLRYDKPRMKSLGGGSFTLCDYKYYDHIPNNYHLEYDGHYYSVNYKLYPQPAILKATFTDILICDASNRLLRQHKRSYAEFPRYITNPQDMKPEHLYYRDINTKNSSYYLNWASRFGPDMKTLIDKVLHSFEFEEQAYNSCNGILHSCDGKPMGLCELAAAECIKTNHCRYSYFRRYLKEFMDRTGEPGELPASRNVRGKENFK